jgi:hypothetical protein
VLGEYLRPFGRLSELGVAVIALIVLLMLPNGLLGVIKLVRGTR